MKRALIATGAALALVSISVYAQSPRVTGSVDSHVAASKAAAGTLFTALQQRVCESAIPVARTGGAGGAAQAGGAGRQAGPPPASSWHAEPAKVFDNLYF